MAIVADLHTHTLVSGHAYGTIRENAMAASERGLSVLGITEHAPGIPGTCHGFYFCNFETLPRLLYGVRMIYGSEINVLNDGTLSLPEKRIKLLDYAIAGIHVQCYEDEGREKNTDNLISCMKHDKVKLVSHPDDDHTPLNYGRLVRAAKKYGVGLEVNNSSLLKGEESRWNCFANYREMLQLCKEYEVPIALNSDAHDPCYVGEVRRAMAFVEQEGMPEELIINTNLERLLTFLGLPLETDGLPYMGY